LEQRNEDDKKARLYRLWSSLAQNAKGLVLGPGWPLEGS